MSATLNSSYDFAGLCYINRAVQIAIVACEFMILHSNSAQLGGVAFLFYSAIVVLNLIHLASRWYYNIDGRYDLKQLMSEGSASQKLQYAIALLAPVFIGSFCYLAVPCLRLAAMVQSILAFAQFGMEIFEVYVKGN